MNNEQITLCRKLTQILGYSTFTKIGKRCTGKWSGTTDYFLLFDGQYEFFISNGMNCFNEKLKEHIQKFQIFEKYKTEMLHTICNQVEKDNQIAVQEGLLPVKCISLDLCRKPNNHFLIPYLRIEVAGIQLDFIESRFIIAIFNNELEKHFGHPHPLFTAGGIKKPTFILSNVRFSHLEKLYCIK